MTSAATRQTGAEEGDRGAARRHSEHLGERMMKDAPKVYLVRAGRHGQDEDHALEHNLAVIPHAGAIGALMVAMIQAPFRTALVPAVGGPDRDPPRRVAARRRAVRLPSITPRTDRKELATTTTGLLAKRGIHGVGVRRRRSDWTPSRNRGTTVWTGSNGRNSRRSRGSGGRVRALLSIVLRRLP